MFGYVRPYKSELLVREYDQYKGAYCQLCRALGREYGWTARLALSYDCTFYALLALSVSGAAVCAKSSRCAANPLKKCTYLESGGEEYKKAAALSVLLTCHKLRDNLKDEGFFKSFGSRILLPFAARKAKKAAARYPFLEQAAQKAMDGQKAAEEAGAGVDACAEPTANLLAELFRELGGEDRGQCMALERFGYFLGRWVYLMDAADDLKEDIKNGGFNPFALRLGLPPGRELTAEKQRQAEEACNQALNATVAQMLLPLNLIELGGFGPILENIVKEGLPEVQREILFLHIREKKGRKERERI